MRLRPRFSRFRIRPSAPESVRMKGACCNPVSISGNRLVGRLELTEGNNMDDTANAGPSESDVLRDTIFQTRLEIEQLRRSGNIDAINKAVDRLRVLLRAQQGMQKFKTREL